eukprot:Phypoly_transcript_17749.p1 GENE.Phypoly_transcript_17749~~Phypoly_transcript_17749.p1  ORF type:complete len:200 (+),score=49.61 Phypoly_transcript_17749:160-759(+)
MEVEVKIRLPERKDYDKVSSLLGSPKKVYEQENIFFDGVNHELKQARTALRLRFFQEDSQDKCVITLKEGAKIIDGISRAAETEKDIDPVTARKMVDQPSLILSDKNDLLKHAVEKYKLKDLICLGGFKNSRRVFDWENHKLELDETRYDFGTTWEIEIESTTPEEIQTKVQKFLTENNIPFKQSLKSKFANFLAKKVD